MTWISIMFMYGGDLSNQLVARSNDGRMPVAMQKADVLFVIGPAQYGVKFFLSADILKRYHPEKQPLTENTRFRILADRIPVSFSVISVNKLPVWLSEACDSWDFPIARDNGIASIGDLFLWSGKWLGLISFPFVLIYFVWGICLLLPKKRF